MAISAMASRHLLPRLLRPVMRSVTSRIITPGYVAHPQAPQTYHVLRPSLLSGYGYASTSLPLGFRGLSSCNLFLNSASLSIPRYCSEFHMGRSVGDGVSVLPGILHVRVLETLTLNLVANRSRSNLMTMVQTVVLNYCQVYFDKDKRHSPQSFCGWMLLFVT